MDLCRSQDYTPPTPTYTTDDLELVAEECLPEYDNLQLLQSEPIQADKILSVKSANGAFKYEARNLQVPGYDPYLSIQRSARRHPQKRRGRRSINSVRSQMNFIHYTYQNLQWTGPTSATMPLSYEDANSERTELRVERTELRYRVPKGINELPICELETYYVRRYNKFPFFVKSVTCQKNKSIDTYILCKRRYEKGHILRLEKMSHCYQEENSMKWIHDWETRVVGCDAVVPLDVDRHNYQKP